VSRVEPRGELLLRVMFEGASTLTLHAGSIRAQWDQGRGAETWHRPAHYSAEQWREVYLDMLERFGRGECWP